ncbi:hypothetical protein [Rhizobium sp. 2MFCol3.1]|uniref:hypothetical protein n=1 Tax=Rhizobium sp. 2MFCol3.1 TaxID=1246459 RepID=UPI000475FA26|nr:hypothetical protein [Rhizobium sp. 2MFCol3.1]
MTTNEIITLCLSGASFIVSAFVAGWAVYRDVIQKPKFRVYISVKNIFMPDGKTIIGPDIFVEATNLGPIPNRVIGTYARPGWFARKRGKLSAYIHPDYAHLAHNVPKDRIEVGNGATFVFPLTSTFLDGDFRQVGVSDGFGRTHWASRKILAEAAKQVKESRSKREVE